jgi:hypothetical protein
MESAERPSIRTAAPRRLRLHARPEHGIRDEVPRHRALGRTLVLPIALGRTLVVPIALAAVIAWSIALARRGPAAA